MPRTWIPLLITLLLASPAHAKPNFDRLFAGRDGCFELYDLKTNKLLVRHNPAHCKKRVSPASTFRSLWLSWPSTRASSRTKARG